MKTEYVITINKGNSRIWMKPILERIEKRSKEEARRLAYLDLELPSFVDDMCMDIVDWDGGCGMQRVEVNAKRIVREVAEENTLPLEEIRRKSCTRGNHCIRDIRSRRKH